MHIRYLYTWLLLISLVLSLKGDAQERGLMLDLGSMSNVGIVGYITPQKAHFTPYMGMYWNFMGSRQYFRIPFGLDFHFGNKFRFVFGAALYQSWVVRNRGPVWQNHAKSMMGGHIHLGFEAVLSPRFTLGMRWRRYRDLTVSYETTELSKMGDPYVLDHYYKERSINILVKYRLNNFEKRKRMAT